MEYYTEARNSGFDVHIATWLDLTNRMPSRRKNK